MDNNKLLKRLTAGIVVFVALCICFCVTTFALIYAIVTVEDNVFTTGTIDINLNDGKEIVYDTGLVEPGQTIKKEFFIENTGTAPLYYKLYFSNVQGSLATLMKAAITDGVNVLYEGTPATLNKENATAVWELGTGEKKTLTLTLHCPIDVGSEAQNMSLGFDLHADAVQIENNTDKYFPEP